MEASVTGIYKSINMETIDPLYRYIPKVIKDPNSAEEEKKSDMKSNISQIDEKFEDNNREGFSICNYANGDCYIGEWKNNMKDGKGSYVFSSGGVYQGD